MITFRKIDFDPPIEPTDSRLNAGILYLPKKFIGSQTEHGTPEERDSFVEELMAEMRKPLSEKDASVVVPIVKIMDENEESESKATEQ